MGTEVDVRYAMSGDARLAFRVRAGGTHAIVRVPAWFSNQDVENLELQVRNALHERLSSFATFVSYDQRGTGLSDPVSLADLPTLEGWADDLHAVVTAAALERRAACGRPGWAGGSAVRGDPPGTDSRTDPDQHVRDDRPTRGL